jgi:hypothetical protein
MPFMAGLKKSLNAVVVIAVVQWRPNIFEVLGFLPTITVGK